MHARHHLRLPRIYFGESSVDGRTLYFLWVVELISSIKRLEWLAITFPRIPIVTCSILVSCAALAPLKLSRKCFKISQITLLWTSRVHNNIMGPLVPQVDKNGVRLSEGILWSVWQATVSCKFYWNTMEIQYKKRALFIVSLRRRAGARILLLSGGV